MNGAEMEAVKKNLRGMAPWLKFLGVLNIIYGALTALTLVGILWIFLGVLLWQAGNRGKEYAETDNPALLAEHAAKLKTYFLINGILAIIGIILGVVYLICLIIMVVVGGIGGFGDYSTISGLLHLT